MPKFDDYTQKTAPEDTDIALILDKTANVNKKTPFSGIWNWIVSKLTSAVISQLETTNKSIIPAINELNSKTNVFVTTKQGFLDLNSKLTKGICYPIFLNNTAVSEITNGRYNVSGKGIFSCGDVSDIMLVIGNGDTILTGRIQADQDPTLFVVRPESVGNNAGGHNSIFRGKNLGSSVSSSQWSAIQSASFDDIFVGDYWVIGGVNWRVAALDYFYNTGDTALTKHHAVIVPDTQLYTANMNDTNTTEGAYVNSKMRTENLEQAKTTIKNTFGASHVLSHRLYLTNATKNGMASGGTWYDADVEIMTEHMVYGNGVFSPVSGGSSIPNNYRIEKSQLPLFVFRPDLISNRQWYWLRDVISSAGFADVASDGGATYNLASDVYGVRPYFLIG